MKESVPAVRRLDVQTLEMIFVVTLVSLYDFILSSALSLPVVLHDIPLLRARSFDRGLSALEYIAPLSIFVLMSILWLLKRDNWVRMLALIYLAWVTLRLMAKVVLLFSLVVVRQHALPSVLLRDTVLLWFVILLVFATWYWIVDRGGPHARRGGMGIRPDFGFPQHLIVIPGWPEWMPGFWDYLFLAFSASTQFGAGDTAVLSRRAKGLVMLQVMLSITVLVFIASMATGLVH